PRLTTPGAGNQRHESALRTKTSDTTLARSCPIGLCPQTRKTTHPGRGEHLRPSIAGDVRIKLKPCSTDPRPVRRRLIPAGVQRVSHSVEDLLAAPNTPCAIEVMAPILRSQRFHPSSLLLKSIS